MYIIVVSVEIKTNSSGPLTRFHFKSMCLHSDLSTSLPATPYHPPRQNVIFEWYRAVMFSARHLLSNHKHKRVIHRRVYRTNSLQDESEDSPVWLPYIYPTFLALLVLSLPRKYVTPTVIGIAISKRIFFRLYSVFTDRYLMGRQPGPTYRERLYYYVDYWISTNP